jgi:hypothetical protein
MANAARAIGRISVRFIEAPVGQCIAMQCNQAKAHQMSQVSSHVRKSQSLRHGGEDSGHSTRAAATHPTELA